VSNKSHFNEDIVDIRILSKTYYFDASGGEIFSKEPIQHLTEKIIYT